MNDASKSFPTGASSSLQGDWAKNSAGVIVVGAKGRIRSISPGIARLLKGRAAVTANSDSKLLPASLHRVFSRVLSTGKSVENRRILIDSPSGNLPMTVTGVPLVSGKVVSGVVLALHPANRLQEFDQNLRRLDRLANVGMLSAGMAHEIKNALVSVKTFIDLLLDRNQDAELADVVGREMRRINDLVSQTLKFARPSRPVFSAVRLHDVLDHSLRMVQPQLRTRSIAVKRWFDATPGVVRGDDYQLEQVFVNLFLNAVEALGMAGELTITTEMVASTAGVGGLKQNPAQVRVIITDTGRGIAPENMSRMFDPFFTTKPEGTGLGLPIARRIVEEHSGKIEATSEIDKGTTVSVSIPAYSGAD
jgi:two-component system, NtrC family, sensor histidine kinase HydH